MNPLTPYFKPGAAASSSASGLYQQLASACLHLFACMCVCARVHVHLCKMHAESVGAQILLFIDAFPLQVSSFINSSPPSHGQISAHWSASVPAVPAGFLQFPYSNLRLTHSKWWWVSLFWVKLMRKADENLLHMKKMCPWLVSSTFSLKSKVKVKWPSWPP